MANFLFRHCRKSGTPVPQPPKRRPWPAAFVAVTKTSAAVAAAVLISDLCFLASVRADATLPPVKLPPVTLDTRAPQSSDDSSVPYPNGGQWQAGGETWKLGDNTAGYATWSRIGARALPLDVIGLYVSAAAASAAGSGYNVGDTILLTGGVKLTVATLTGGAGTGVATITVTTPYLHACGPTNPVAQQSSSGGGTGASFTLTLLYPTAYGTRLLGRCYSGYALTAVRSDTGEARQIGFLADGALDTPNLDAFAQGDLAMALAYTQSDTGLVVPRISVWNDQGGQGSNATQTTAANRPTIAGIRKLGNARSVMFDAGTSTNWSPATTMMTLPAGVSITGNNSTIAALSGHVAQYQIGTSPVYVGSAALGSHVGIAFHDASAASEECANGSSGTNSLGNYVPTDTPQVEICNNGASSTVYANNFQSVSNSGGTHTGSSSTVTGGALGAAAGNGAGTTGLMDLAAVIIVPWSLDANTQQMLQASLNREFGLTPQVGGMIVAGADSQVSGYASTFQQSWPRAMMELLGRRDIQLVNTAKPGQTLNAWGNSAWFMPLTALQGYNGPNKWVMSDGGYNDIVNSGATAAQVEGYFATAAANAHAAGAKFACVTTALPNGSQATITAMAAVNAYLRGNAGGFCDLVIDPAAYAAVFGITTPGMQANPWWEAQDGYLHPSSQGAALIAAIAANAMKGVLQ